MFFEQIICHCQGFGFKQRIPLMRRDLREWTYHDCSKEFFVNHWEEFLHREGFVYKLIFVPDQVWKR